MRPVIKRFGFFKKLLAVGICLLILLPTSCRSILAPGSNEPLPNQENLFARKQLDELDGDKDHLVENYDRIARALYAKETAVKLSRLNPVNESELGRIMEAVQLDLSDVFWMNTEYRGTVQDEKVILVEFAYFSNLLDQDEAFEAGIQRLLEDAHLTSEMSLVEKELALHDALCRFVTFSGKTEHAFSAYDAIVNGEATSWGYAKAFHILLNRVGISSFVVFGKTAEHGNYTDFAWNLIQLEDGYCYTDIVWGDLLISEEEHEIPYYLYFNRSLAEFNADHFPETSFLLPEGSEDWNYYRQFPESGVEGNMNSADPKFRSSIVSQIRENKTARLYILDADPATLEEDFYEWFTLLGGAFANALGWKNGFTYAFSCYGREAHLYIGPPSKTN